MRDIRTGRGILSHIGVKMEWFAEMLLWISVCVLFVWVCCVCIAVTQHDKEFNPMHKKSQQVKEELEKMRCEVRDIKSELQGKYGDYFLNQTRVRERVIFLQGATECMVAEDHPILTQPSVERVCEMGKVTLKGEPWIWCTTKSVKAELAKTYAMYL